MNNDDAYVFTCEINIKKKPLPNNDTPAVNLRTNVTEYPCN
jgi:hypothetical protein